MESVLKKFLNSWEKLEYFENQYKVILLLLHFGIRDLPPELVYKILREYIYITPIRISEWCMESLPCQHSVLLPGEKKTRTLSSDEIRGWFLLKRVPVPEHYKYKTQHMPWIDDLYNETKL